MFHETTLTLYFMKSPERQISQCILPFKELSNPNINKATQNTNIPTKIIKENSDIFGDFIFSNLNCCINTSLYPSLLKRADITPVHKKDSYCLATPNCMNGSYLSKCQNIFQVPFSLNTNVDLGRVLVLSTV